MFAIELIVYFSNDTVCKLLPVSITDCEGISNIPINTLSKSLLLQEQRDYVGDTILISAKCIYYYNNVFIINQYFDEVKILILLIVILSFTLLVRTDWYLFFYT